MGLIKKSFSTLNRKTLLILYKALVRPHLEYANVVWGPDYTCDMMERVQRRATKCIQDLSSLEYDQCLVTLKLPTLAYQRHRADMIMVYNIMQGNVDLQPEIFFHLNLSSVTRGTTLNFLSPTPRRMSEANFSQ